MPISSRFVVRSTVILLTVGFLTLLGIVGATVWLGERSRIYFSEVIEVRDARTAAVELRTALQTAESSERGYLLTSNEIYLAPYDNAKAQAMRQLGVLRRALTGHKEEASLLERLSAVIGTKIAEMDQIIALKNGMKEDDALAIMRTNRGKALTDESNLFLSGIIRRMDARLIDAVSEQDRNANWLRWVSILGGLVIVFVVGGVTYMVLQYAREVAQARDEVRLLNASLEERVKLRTADLAKARDHAETLLSEVNHRVANSLAMVTSLVQLQSRAVTDQSAKNALAETQARIYAIASVHKRLYTSGDVRVVSLDEYLAAILDHLAASMRAEGSGATLRYELAPVKMKTDASVSLGVAVTELVTNAFKYAYPGKAGEVRVRLTGAPQQGIELVVEDDGAGRNGKGTIKGTGLGSRIVTAMASNLGGEIQYIDRSPGTAARLTFPLQPE